jgi:hypothetical protein
METNSSSKVGRLGQHGAAGPERLVDDGGFHMATVRRAVGDPSRSSREVLVAGQPLASSPGFGDGGAQP